jgi:hypothetical protein
MKVSQVKSRFKKLGILEWWREDKETLVGDCRRLKQLPSANELWHIGDDTDFEGVNELIRQTANGVLAMTLMDLCVTATNRGLEIHMEDDLETLWEISWEDLLWWGGKDDHSKESYQEEIDELIEAIQKAIAKNKRDLPNDNKEV